MVDLSAPLRTAIIGAASITTHLSSPTAVYTRRPIPDATTYPVVAISPDVTFGDEDGLDVMRPVITRDVCVYGEQPDQYRAVETAAYAIRTLFHRRPFALSVPDYSVTGITAAGPMAAPVDDDRLVGRVVILTIRLSATA